MWFGWMPYVLARKIFLVVIVSVTTASSWTPRAYVLKVVISETMRKSAFDLWFTN